jgi:hypothetical protein
MALKHPNTWEPKVKYNLGDTVWLYNEKFTCVIEHESNVFANDYFNDKKWIRNSEIPEIV